MIRRSIMPFCFIGITLVGLRFASSQDSGIQFDSRPDIERSPNDEPWLFTAMEKGGGAARPFVDSSTYKLSKKAYETSLRSTQTQYYQPKVNSWKDTLTGSSPGGASKTPLSESELYKAWKDEGKPGNLKDWTEARKAAADEAKKTGDLLKQGSNAIDVAGPVATFFGTLSGGGSLMEAGAGALNDFGKYWTKKAAGGLGGAGGFAATGPVGGAIGSVGASEGASKGWDATIGKKTADLQQTMANVDAIFRNIPSNKLDHYFALEAYGRSGPPEPKKLGLPGPDSTSPAANQSSTPSPRSVIAKAPLPVPVPSADSGEYGPRPDNWPPDEPWPPTPERIHQLINAKKRIDVANKPNSSPTDSPTESPTPNQEQDTSPTPSPTASPTSSVIGENPATGEDGSADDFSGSNAGQSTTGIQDNSSGAKKLGIQALKGFDTSGFAAGQAKDAAASQNVQGDYADADRLESELRAAEQKYEQAQAEASRAAAEKRSAEQRSEAERRKRDAYNEMQERQRAYQKWLAQRQQRQVPQGHQNAGALMDAPH